MNGMLVVRRIAGAAVVCVGLAAVVGGVRVVPGGQSVRVDGLVLKNPPAELKPALARFLERERRFKSLLTPPPKTAFPGPESFRNKVQAIEKTIFALFDLPNAAQLAAGFGREVSLYY